MSQIRRDSPWFVLQIVSESGYLGRPGLEDVISADLQQSAGPALSICKWEQRKITLGRSVASKFIKMTLRGTQ